MESLDFTWENRHYHLEFPYYPIIQLKGNSATGKSLFVHDFILEMQVNDNLRNSIVINSANSGSIDSIMSKQYNYVIIDNADTVITPETDQFILSQIIGICPTHYILIGRKNYVCIGALSGIGNFICEKDNKTDNYYFYADFSSAV